MKVTVNLTMNIKAMHYPLSVLNDLLARLIDELNNIELTYGDDNEQIFPIHSEMKYDDGDTGNLIVNIVKS